MGLDGIPRPARITPYTDAMNPYVAEHLARQENADAPLVKSLNREERIRALQKEQHEQGAPDEDDGQERETFSEEEAEQIRIFAKMRGLMNFALDSGKQYSFQISPDTGLIDLVELESGQVVLQLLPDELMSLSQKIQRYAGFLTDRSG
jgi:hypothetical protein